MKTLALPVAALVLASVFVSIPVRSAEDSGPLSAPSPCTSFSSAQPGHLVPSWDGTLLAADIYVPAGTASVPLIVKGHGYPNQRGNEASVAPLVDAGYMVLVWDERGFGQSGGKVHLLDPAWEGRDVIALIEYVKAHGTLGPRLLNVAGNPVVGMAGGSYGGGIQWNALVADRVLGPRPDDTAPTDYIDALVPEITWYSLEDSLLPGGVPKLWITTLLLATGETSSRTGGAPPPSDRFCPNTGGQEGLIERYVDGAAMNGPTAATTAFLAERSISTWLDDLGAHVPPVPPVLLVQGLRDTLFPTNEAVHTFEAVKDLNVANKLMFFPAGHGWKEQPPEVQIDVRAWFNHTLKGDALPSRMDAEDFIYASEGRLAADSPTWGTDFVYAGYDATKVLAGATGNTFVRGAVAPILTLGAPSSYADLTFFQGDIDAQQEPGRAPNADAPGTVAVFDFLVGPSGVTLAGTPSLTLTLTTTTNELFLFGKMYDVDPATGWAGVIYHQVMAKAVRNAALTTETVSWDLASLTEKVAAGHTLRVAVSTGDVSHAASRQPGITFISGATVKLPIVAGTVTAA